MVKMVQDEGNQIRNDKHPNLSKKKLIVKVFVILSHSTLCLPLWITVLSITKYAMFSLAISSLFRNMRASILSIVYHHMIIQKNVLVHSKYISYNIQQKLLINSNIYQSDAILTCDKFHSTILF